MTSIRVAASRDHLERDGRPWFYLADTIWMALTHMPIDEWRRYLGIRREQGFNALQISILPVLQDMSAGQALPTPFEGFWEGRPRFGPLTASYRESSARRLEMAAGMGFTPVLVDIWSNYAPDTMFSRRDPRYVMPDGAVDEYLGSVVDSFEQFEPIHVLSGDDDFGSQASTDFYLRALRTIRRLAPNALTAMHLQPTARLPDPLADADELDLYIYQSGHHVELAHLTYDTPASFLTRPVRRPIINAEPCYEGHGYGHRRGRFDRDDVRRAIWQSLVGGASAGLAYGAHGVWSWHHEGEPFNNAGFSGMPFDRWDAMRFEGAWDASFARRIIELEGLHRLQPRQDLLLGDDADVRVATSHDGRVVAVYAPYAVEVRLALSRLPASVTAWELPDRRSTTPWVTQRDGHVELAMPSRPVDRLVLLHLEEAVP